MLSLFPSRYIVLTIHNWSIHWYGLFYVLSFLLAIWLLPSLQKWRNFNLSRYDWAELVSGAALGVIIGGRLGYVLLYQPNLLWLKPRQMLAIWSGGMSSHGGFVAVALIIWLYVRYLMPSRPTKNKTNTNASYWRHYLRVMDIIVVPAALGLTLGRIGNVINQELFPTPLAQALAVAKDLFIAVLTYAYLRHSRSRPGAVLALFLLIYGLLRFLIEFMRAQDHALVYGLTLGQLYTLPFFIVGLLLAVYVVRTNEHLG